MYIQIMRHKNQEPLAEKLQETHNMFFNGRRFFAGKGLNFHPELLITCLVLNKISLKTKKGETSMYVVYIRKKN